MIIDSHHHFWALRRGEYGWLTSDLKPLYRNFGPEDLRPHLGEISQTILVQAAATVAETRYLLGLAQTCDFVAGVVGWIDFESPHPGEVLDGLTSDPAFLGVRPMIQDIENDEWVQGREIDPAFSALVERDLTFDALVLPHHLDGLLERIDRHAGLRVVIDHGAKPEIRRKPWAAFDAWRDSMQRLARRPTVFCKLSGLVTEAGPRWSVDDLRPYVDVLLDAFGPYRLMWGSDWPVVNLAGGFDAWRAASHELLDALSPDERLAVLGATAATFYKLQS